MAHQTSHRRNLAAPDPQLLVDPTSRKAKAKPNPSAATTAQNHRHQHPIIHPLPDPTPPSTIQTISHRFSKLYINQKKVVSKKPHPHPQPDPNLHDTSCTTLTKSSSLHGRIRNIIPVAEKNVEKNKSLSAKIKVAEKDDLKKPYFEEDPPKRSSFNEIDVKKGLKLMVDEEKLKGFQEGCEVRGRNSLSSIPPTVNGGRRKSFCSSQLELADFFSFSGVKVVAVDMPPFIQIHAVNCARKALDSLEKFTSKTLAFTLKKEFDGVYGPAWHCIVGTSFGSFVTHSVGGFMYFSMDQKQYILLFKTAVQRAD